LGLNYLAQFVHFLFWPILIKSIFGLGRAIFRLKIQALVARSVTLTSHQPIFTVIFQNKKFYRLWYELMWHEQLLNGRAISHI